MTRALNSSVRSTGTSYLRMELIVIRRMVYTMESTPNFNKQQSTTKNKEKKDYSKITILSSITIGVFFALCWNIGFILNCGRLDPVIVRLFILFDPELFSRNSEWYFLR